MQARPRTPCLVHTYIYETAPEAFVGAVGQVIEAWGPSVERGISLPGEAEAIALLLDAGTYRMCPALTD